MTHKRIGRKAGVMVTAVLLAASLAACGSSGSLSYTESAVNDTAPAAVKMDYAAADVSMELTEEAYDGGAGMSYGQESGAIEEPVGEAVNVPENVTERKLIRTVNIDTETEQFDTLVPALQTQVEQLGGYIEEMSVYNNGNYYYDGKSETLRGAGMTARVPKDRLDGFLAQVGEQSNVVSQSERVEDVTLQYVDLDSHKRVLLSEQERLIELLSQAETVEDLIAIEGRLSEVRYQIESMESQLRTYDNKIDYSTVYLSISEVRKYTPPQDSTVWEKISNGFVNSLESIGTGICDFLIGLLINLPYIVLWAVIIVVAVLIMRQVIRAVKGKKVKSGSSRGAGIWGTKKDKVLSQNVEKEPVREVSCQEQLHQEQTSQEQMHQEQAKEKEEHGE